MAVPHASREKLLLVIAQFGGFKVKHDSPLSRLLDDPDWLSDDQLRDVVGAAYRNCQIRMRTAIKARQHFKKIGGLQ